MVMTTNWKPLLKGTLGLRAWNYIDKVDLELRVFEQNFLKGKTLNRWIDYGLGSSLFYFYLYKVTGKRNYEKLSESFYNQTLEAMGRLPVWDRLHSGFTGIAWLEEHISQKKSSAEESIDSYLVSKTRKGCLPKTPLGMYSVVDDWVGYGIYALERWPRGQSSKILENLVKLLSRKAKRNRQGVAWFTTKSSLYKSHLYRCGHYNLGIAHGVPGVIGFLSDVLKTKIHYELTLDLLQNSIKWLLAQDDGKHFGYTLPPNSPKMKLMGPRLAWCYGDLGIAVTLLNASRALKDGELEKRALTIAHRAVRFSDSASLITDPYPCHGSSGVFHIFNYIYQSTGDKTFLKSALKWSRKTLDMIEKPRKFSEPVYDLITGKPGIALALLAGISDVSPAWDRLLLVSPKF